MQKLKKRLQKAQGKKKVIDLEKIANFLKKNKNEKIARLEARIAELENIIKDQKEVIINLNEGLLNASFELSKCKK